MNAASLRHHITSFLNGVGQPAEIKGVEKLWELTGEPLALAVTVIDPYTPGTPERRFKITFEEMD